jgi:hypothetical protein
MRLFRSFILRISQILSLNVVICLFLMAATLGIQKQREGMYFTGALFLILLFWFLINTYAVRKVDPELSVEVARILFPAGALLSFSLSSVLSLYLDALIPGTEGKEHWILPFVGLGIAMFLIVRCFDIKWLRGEAEILEMETGQSD